MCTILVHEPEAVISLDLENILHGHRVIKSKSISSLIHHIRYRKFDLLIIDISRIPGWRHIATLMWKFRIPVIFLTSQASFFPKNKKGQQYYPVIELPYTPGDILKALQQFHLN